MYSAFQKKQVSANTPVHTNLFQKIAPAITNRSHRLLENQSRRLRRHLLIPTCHAIARRGVSVAFAAIGGRERNT
jgi:hypothetical protein